MFIVLGGKVFKTSSQLSSTKKVTLKEGNYVSCSRLACEKCFEPDRRRQQHFRTHLNLKCPDQTRGDLNISSLSGEGGGSWVWDASGQRASAGTKDRSWAPRPWQHVHGGHCSCSDWQIIDAKSACKSIKYKVSLILSATDFQNPIHISRIYRTCVRWQNKQSRPQTPATNSQYSLVC